MAAFMLQFTTGICKKSCEFRHFGKEIIMKKFFVTVPLQKEDQRKRFVYDAQGNSGLSMDEATSFPIIPAINGYVAPGGPFRVAAVVQENEDAKRNYEYLRQELHALCERNGLIYPERGVERVPCRRGISTFLSVRRAASTREAKPSKRSVA